MALNPTQVRNVLKIKLYANIFVKSTNQLIGKTCSSDPIQLVKSEGQGYQLAQQLPLCIYYHTRIEERADAVLAVEINLYGEIVFEKALAVQLFPPICALSPFPPQFDCLPPSPLSIASPPV